MKNRKLFLLNPVNYKIKKLFYIIGIILISNILILFFAFYMIQSQQIQSSSSVISLKKAVETDNNIIKSFIKVIDNSRLKRLVLDTKKVKRDHNKSYKTIQSYIQSIKDKNSKMKLYFKIFLVMLTILTLVTFLALILIFSKITGPVFYMNKILKNHLAGKKQTIRPLRDGDEFEELFENLTELIEGKKSKSSKKAVAKKTATKPKKKAVKKSTAKKTTKKSTKKVKAVKKTKSAPRKSTKKIKAIKKKK